MNVAAVYDRRTMPEYLAERLTATLGSDLQALGMALAGALQAGDGAAFQAALKKISARMPEFLESEAMEQLMADEMVRSFLVEGEAEEVENAGNSDGARKGWETRRRNGWKPANRPPGTGSPMKRREVESIELVLDAAFVSTDSRDFATYQKLDGAAAAKIRAATGGKGPDVTGWDRIIEADKVNKILPKHGTDRWPVEEEDFRRLPELLSNPDTQRWEMEEGKPPRLRSEIREGRKVIVVEEAYTGKQQLTTLSIYRP